MKKIEKMIHQIIRFRGNIEAFLVSIEEFSSFTNEQKKHLHLVLTNGGLAAVATIKPSTGPRVWQIELDTNLREV